MREIYKKYNSFSNQQNHFIENGKYYENKGNTTQGISEINGNKDKMAPKVRPQGPYHYELKSSQIIYKL